MSIMATESAPHLDAYAEYKRNYYREWASRNRPRKPCQPYHAYFIGPITPEQQALRLKRAMENERRKAS